MKFWKIMSVLLVLLLLTAACGNTVSPSPAAPEAADAPKTAEKAPEEKAEKEPEAAFEITYTHSDVWPSVTGGNWQQTIVEITNTGDTNLYFDTGNYDLEDSAGKLLASQSYVTVFPNVIAPGEKAYMYEASVLEDNPAEGEIKVLPRVEGKAATVELIRFELTDMELSTDDYGYLQVLGRIENKTDRDFENVYVVGQLYDDQGRCIGQMQDYLPETLTAGAKVGFKLIEFALPDSVNEDSIAEIRYYGYPLQAQFN